MEIILNIVVPTQAWILSFWWLWLFLVLFFLGRSLWLSYVQEYYKHSIGWTMFEMKIPRETLRSPRAMEQVFMSIHGVRNSPSNPKEKWWDGEVTMWFSCEIVSFGGELHFYIRVPEKHKNLVQAAVYAHYPDVEMTEVAEDYVNRMPSDYDGLVKNGYDIFGNELILAKPDSYPIKTYMDFEDNEEERQLDPISTLLETLTKVKPQENIWIQILIQPRDSSWRKEGEEMVEYLKLKLGKERIETQKGGFIITDRSPGETEMMKAVERNIAKAGFETILRYIYMAPKAAMNEGFARRGVISAFNQYASESLNKFKHNVKAWTKVSFWYWPCLFPNRRRTERKRRIYENYRRRKIHEEIFISKLLEMRFFDWGFAAQRSQNHMVLNVEELATIYHPPMAAVLTGPLIKRVEAKKVGPPAGLPIYGEEGEGPDLPGITK